MDNYDDNTRRRADVPSWRIAVRTLALAVVVGVAGSSTTWSGELSDAIQAGDLARLKSAISTGNDINEEGLNGMPLHEAVMFEAVAMVQALVDAGADIEAKNSIGGGRPLHVAAYNRSPDIIKLLLAKGADAESKDGSGRTPLIIAASTHSIVAARALLEGGADPQGRDVIYGDTPLHYAAVAGDVEMAKLLVEWKANVNAAAPSSGGTPLHYAAMDGRVDMIRYLAENGANLTAKDKEGKTPSVFATSKEVKALLQELGAKE